jgi:ATP synthase protein I
MDDRLPTANNSSDAFIAAIDAQAAMKIKSKRDRPGNVLSGLGMTGLIGWSVVLPTLAGTACGVWLDGRYPGSHSWTLTFLLGGLMLGCFNAWHWVCAQDASIHSEEGK